MGLSRTWHTLRKRLPSSQDVLHKLAEIDAPKKKIDAAALAEERGACAHPDLCEHFFGCRNLPRFSLRSLL